MLKHKIELQPYDQYNQELESNVHPRDWVNPVPEGTYNLVVIGAGTAGLVTAAASAGLGAKVALIERGLMGGDCLNVGCVPSKAIISSARVLNGLREGAKLLQMTKSPHPGPLPEGEETNAGKAHFAQIMERMRRLRSGISHHDSAKRFKSLGVDVFIGDGRFVDANTVEVDGVKLNFKKAVIATGARAAMLPIPGLSKVNYLTNESLFSLTELPERLLVIGGGPIGSEMSQTFARFGSKVTLIDKSPHILINDDSEAALVVQKSLEHDGVNILLNAKTTRVEQQGAEIVVFVEINGQQQEVRGDQLLIAIGRQPNVEGLGLEAVGVEYQPREGVKVNEYLQTTNPRIFAAGDICSKYKFTHAADFMARIVIRNSLFMGRGKVTDLTIPWATYTSPELAHVGLKPEEAKARGMDIVTYTQSFGGVDRAILEEDTAGFVKVHVKKGTDQIVGATIVGENAGDMISELTLAITQKVGLSKIASVIHPYPTKAEAIRKLGDQFNKTKLTPFVKGLFQRWLKWSRG